ncbi:hypothetical protein B0A53_04121 [Rhodotorula sp. CCFEE 5036]|nr:hypothetical protein B0A53_04121 [Rhodotorula sp. CCFEE 5036]
MMTPGAEIRRLPLLGQSGGSRMEQIKLYCAGSNSHGQLGVGDDEDRHHFTRSQSLVASQLSPQRIVCGANHTLLLDASSGKVFGAGGNQRGQLGAGHATESRTTAFSPVEIPRLVVQAGVEDLEPEGYTVQDIAATWESSFFLLRLRDPARSDILLSTGANDWGERGHPGADPHTATQIDFEKLAPPVERGAVIRVVDLQAGPRHVVALLEIGPSTAADPLAASTSRSVLSPPSSRQRVLVGWGASRQGQLGSVQGEQSSPPPRITATPQPVLLPPPYQAADVSSFSLGKDHTALLLREADDDSSLPGSSRRVAVLLGSDKHGQLGLARNVGAEPSRTPSQQQQTKMQRCNLLRAEDLLGDDDALDPRHWKLVGVHCTWNSTLCHLERRSSSTCPSSGPTAEMSSRIVGFGHNAHGQLGAGTPTSPSAAVPPNTAKPRPASSLEMVHRITQLSCGSEHVLALLETGEVIGWGWNEHGNLGLESPSGGQEGAPTPSDGQEGTLTDVFEPRRVWPLDGQTGQATSIAAGNATSWIFGRDL